MSHNFIWSAEAGKALASGDLPLANRLSGKWYIISGRVVHGDHLGRKLGFPTANLETEEISGLLIPHGVYAAKCLLNNTVFHGVVNVGMRPTVGGTTLKIEVHLLDFTGDIYGNLLSVEFIARIRDEKKFNNLDDLVLQIKEDIKTARTLLP